MKYLVLDPNKKIGDLVLSSLKTMGVTPKNIMVANSQSEAIAYLREQCPPYLACYVDPKNRDVFGLVDEYKKLIPSRFKRFFLLFSQSKDIYSFAQALEEEVDDYIVEPYSEKKVQQKVNHSIKQKRSPSQYQVLLNECSQYLEKKEYSRANTSASMAMTLHPRPSMAYYYLATVERAQNKSDLAIQNCIEGLQFNKTHFRCLSLLHDLYFEKADYDRAYKVLSRIMEHFPLSMPRILEIFRLSIRLEKFTELQVYCKKILEREDSNIYIIRFCSAGLTICAMNFFNKGDEAAGQAIVDKVLKFSQFDPKVLRNLYKTLVNFGQHQGSEDIFAKFKHSDKETLEWEVCKYLREIHSSKPVDMIILESEERLKLVEFDEDCYRHLLSRSKKEATQEHQSTIEKVGQKYSLQ